MEILETTKGAALMNTFDVELRVKGFLRGMVESAKAGVPYLVCGPLSDEAYRALAIIEGCKLARWVDAESALMAPTREGIEMVEGR